MSQLQIEVTLALVRAAQTAKKGGFNRYQATKALRDAARKHEINVSNNDIRRTVGCVYAK
jgi:hypothetical protein